MPLGHTHVIEFNCFDWKWMVLTLNELSNVILQNYSKALIRCPVGTSQHSWINSPLVYLFCKHQPSEWPFKASIGTGWKAYYFEETW